jgi:hypothetical protein
MNHHTLRVPKAVLGLAGGLALAATSAEAKVTSVTVEATRDFEEAAGYTYAEITMKGSVARRDGTIGRYSVPATIVFPRRDRGNGVGVVDWLNSAFYHFFAPDDEFQTHQFTRLATGKYLFEEGYTYVTVQWNKAVTEVFGPTRPVDGEPHNRLVYGSIERGADAWEILLDAARLLKDPRLYPLSPRPAPVATVFSSGYSQGGALQLEMLAEDLDPTRVYDGHLIQMIGLACWKRDDTPPFFGSLGDCRPLPTNGRHAPVVFLASESDMLVYHPTVLGVGKSAFFARNAASRNWRHYEMAGVSHLPEPVLSLRLPNQNTGDPRPLFRAAFRNLTRWTHGRDRIPPPPSRYFEGTVDATDAFIPVRDPDGHFAGGLRLPHVASRGSRRVAGAPLGTHAPLNPQGFDPLNVFVMLGGTFTRYGDAELAARYPSRREYVGRVQRAAADLFLGRYITREDARALRAAAEREPLPAGIRR